ncbi:MAG: type II secretion system protein [Candidatus Saccharimonadales bacterium]
MVKGAERGFTIIEVMLFLAITGGLFAALMVGVSNSITQQRYLDSVRSYKSLLQQQYSDVLNVRNENLEGKCNTDGSIDENSTRDGKRGTSKCVLLGRAIRVTNDGKSVVTASITGYDPINTGQDSDHDGVPDSSQISNASDIIVLTNYYKAKLANFDRASVDFDWDSQAFAVNDTNSHISSKSVILIMKSPASGLVRVFVSEDTDGLLNVNNDLTTFINETSSAVALKVCIDGNSGLLPKQTVVINPIIAGPDAVATVDDGSSECK